MGQKMCTSCWGWGSYTMTEKAPPSNGGMFDYVQVRKTCTSCGGSGSIWVNDPSIAVPLELSMRGGECLA